MAQGLTKENISIVNNIFTSGPFLSLSGGTVSGNTFFSSGLSATTISATTFYGDGSNLSGISTANYYTTAATLNGATVFFDRNDILSAYTLDLSSISGGSSSNLWSASTGSNSIIANNGTNNLASGNYSIAGGSGNTALGNTTFIGNGILNTATGDTSFIGNGSGNTANGIYSIVVNGINNQSLGSSSTILGGNSNYTYPNTNFAIILGGSGNTIYNMPGMGSGPSSPCGGAFFPPCSFGLPHHTFNLIGNGDKNSIKDQTTYCSILNGTLNEVSTGDTFSFILNGNNNIVNTGSNYSFILEGNLNYTEANYASVFNGSGNSVFTSGGTVVNGFKNALLINANNSVILGISNFTGTSANTLYTSNANLANGGGVIFSAGTDLYNIFLKTGDVASFTGGTVTGITIFSAGASATTFSANTFYSGGTNLYDIIHSNVTAATNSLTSVAVQNGLNTYTGGTANLPTVNVSALTITNLTVSGSTSLATVSATTFISGSTNLYNIFQLANTPSSQIQPGLNTYTGGTSSFPTVNVSALTIDNIFVSGNSIFNTLSATTISATTFYGSGMNLTGMPVFTGGTINQLNVTGSSYFSNGISATTVSATTYFGVTKSFGGGFDGGGSVLLTGNTIYKVIHDTGTITGWDLVFIPSGIGVFDIWKISTGQVLPTSANSICGTNLPQISTGLYSGSTNLSTWTNTVIAAGDIVGININSVTSALKATLTVSYLKNI